MGNHAQSGGQLRSGAATAMVRAGLAAIAAATALTLQAGGAAETPVTAMPPAMAAKPPPDRIAHPDLLVQASGRSSHKTLAQHLARRFRIAPEVAEMLVNITYEVGDQAGLDPLLILAVIAVESRFNPIAESERGARGLMQVIPKYHFDKFDTQSAEQTLHPVPNIRAGTRVLKECIDRSVSLEAGLQKYNGAQWDDSRRYAQRILSERARYLQVTHGAIALVPDASARAAPAPQQRPGANANGFDVTTIRSQSEQLMRPM